MTDNPFQSPAASDGLPPYPVQPGASQTIPGGITPIAVICIVLGVFGLLGSCMGSVSYGFMGAIESVMDEAAGNAGNSPEMELQRLNFAATRKVMIPNLIVMGINFIVGTLLIVGSIGVLQRKDGGRNLLRTGMLAAVFYSVLKVIVSIYTQITTMGAMKEGFQKMADGDNEAMEMGLQFAQIGGIVGMVFSGLIGIGMVGFYLWSRGYLNKDHVVAYFSGDHQSDNSNVAY